MKILVIGDLHFRATSPRNRTDDYLTTLEEKLLEVWEIAKREQVDLILQVGDIFHEPVVPIPVLMRAYGVFSKAPLPIRCIIGNHDVFGYNIDTYPRTSLYLLRCLAYSTINVYQGKVISGGGGLSFNYVGYSRDNDVNGKGYQVPDELQTEICKIAVVHGMLLDHDLPYQASYTNLHKLETNANIVITGHDHVGYGVVKRSDGKLFVNPGALMRLTASEAEMKRTVQVAVINTNTLTAELIPIKRAKNAVEVLDRSKLEEKKERDYAISEFATLIKTGKGVFTQNLDEIVLNIGKEQNVDQNIIEKAVELLRGEFNNERN